jgi:hypothetical protein
MTYQQVAFTLPAVLLQEQFQSNFLEQECDILCALKDDFASKSACCVHCVDSAPAGSRTTDQDYMNEALSVSSVAPAMKP